MPYDFAQDPLFNKCQREKCVWQGVTFMEERRQNEKRDSSSFAELGSLVRMND